MAPNWNCVRYSFGTIFRLWKGTYYKNELSFISKNASNALVFFFLLSSQQKIGQFGFRNNTEGNWHKNGSSSRFHRLLVSMNVRLCTWKWNGIVWSASIMYSLFCLFISLYLFFFLVFSLSLFLLSPTFFLSNFSLNVSCFIFFSPSNFLFSKHSHTINVIKSFASIIIFCICFCPLKNYLVSKG